MTACQARRESPRKTEKRSILYPLIICIITFITSIYYFPLGDFFTPLEEPKLSFVEREGNQFILEGKPFYINGWNSYWLMDQAVEKSTRFRVSKIFQIGKKLGLTVCRTWAFNDGDYRALQVSLGTFDERVFKALDFVIMEARKNGIRLILSLVNNLKHYGGKTQYVKWAWNEGIALTSSNDSFFYDPSIRSYFKIYMKTILTRKNHLTGIEYRDDPTIFAWELMNEPQCLSDPSGDTLQEWIEEMSQYIKSIDSKHLLTVGLEGFYSKTNHQEKLNVNPKEWYSMIGSDFIRNSKISPIDFASVHIYPDQWLEEAGFDEKINFTTKWMNYHIEDGEKELNKPVLCTEFGLSNLNKGFDPSQREIFYKNIFDIIYNSAAENGAGSGALIWQIFIRGMENYNDEFGVFPELERSSLYNLIKDQSCRLAALRNEKELERNRQTC
ncbi:hypothetical protein LUZ60_012432 [Juncus effusus]|nr:hypothetical protein LUZ60_012432 [Juncus effusus]